MTEARDCPFCGRAICLTDEDTLYPTGTYWREEEGGYRSYHGFYERLEGDGMVYKLGCSTNYGGCGAEIHGDSIEEVVDLWNKRASDGMVQVPKNRAEADLMARLAALWFFENKPVSAT